MGRNIGRARIGRRAAMLGGALAASGVARASAVMATLRLGVLQFGTVQWVAATMRAQGLDAAHGLAIAPVILANTDAARVALLAGSVDIAVSDWPFVAAQRARGAKLCFAPFSASLGGIMVPAGSRIKTLADLRGARLGVAGGPLDKSWLIVLAAAQAAGIDLSKEHLAWGAPPLLGAKLAQGELDAVLTFWNFCARLEAAGFREAISVDACAATLGITTPPSLVGYVFSETWALANRPVIDGFLAAAHQSARRLATDPAAWAAIRPLLDAPDDRLADALHARFIAGLRYPDAVTERREATRLLAVLLRAGGKRATDGLATLPPGVFWPGADGG